MKNIKKYFAMLLLSAVFFGTTVTHPFDVSAEGIPAEKRVKGRSSYVTKEVQDVTPPSKPKVEFFMKIIIGGSMYREKKALTFM